MHRVNLYKHLQLRTGSSIAARPEGSTADRDHHRQTMPTTTHSVPSEFVRRVARALHADEHEQAAAAIGAALHEPRRRDYEQTEQARYYALCQRAWIHWTHYALDHITKRTLGQSARGTYTPSRVLDAQQAAEAAASCALHARLVEVASAAHWDSAGDWQLEAARHVHASTGQALKVAATLDKALRPEEALREGVAHAADALAACVNGRFVEDAVREVRETLAAMG